MKIKLPLLVVLVLLSFQIQVLSGSFTNLAVLGGAGQTMSMIVKTGQPAKAQSIYGLNGGARLTLTIGTIDFTYDTMNYNATSTTATQGPPTVAGPATITLSTIGSGGRAFCAIELINPSEQFTPSTAVVIPADSGGPVNIILESSTDLINWTSALPGSYGTSTTNRFFRVRAERTQ